MVASDHVHFLAWDLALAVAVLRFLVPESTVLFLFLKPIGLLVPTLADLAAFVLSAVFFEVRLVHALFALLLHEVLFEVGHVFGQVVAVEVDEL